MNNNIFKLFFSFTKTQRAGIFLLFILIIGFQLALFFCDFSLNSEPIQNQKWLALQQTIDSLKEEQQSYVPKIYPFNPNFITDYKGYKLGMTTQQIDRLLAFRKTNQYVNSAQDFQAVTGISDSLLKVISPYFKFPDWVTHSKSSNFKKFENNFPKKEPIIVKDINQATAEDLMKVHGIGEGLSARILKEKEKFGSFASMDQMIDVWGLNEEVVKNLNKYFKIITVPSELKKIKINEANVKTLMTFPYFRYQIAKEIVIYRSANGDFSNIEDLTKIKGFPVDKLKIIALYLEF
jgi:DNA uptake protein ComE-like DNA-binding protein